MIWNSRKILSLHCASIIPRIKFRFSQNLSPYSPLEARAYLASQIIKKIRSPYPNTHASLPEELIQAIERAPSEFESEKRFFRDMFTTGIKIDRKTFNQQRMTFGMHKTPSHGQTFTFFPTRLITGQIFNFLYENLEANALITGHYGISKSVSVMLFTILSNIIAQYKFKTFGQPQTKWGKEIIESPKVVYYNINPLDFTIENFRNEILKQCKSELEKQEIQKFLNYDSNINIHFKKTLKRHYQQRQVPIIMFFDQIQAVMSVKRDSEKGTSIQNQLDKEQIQEIKIFLQRINSVEFKAIYFLSSTDIQRRILNQFKLGSMRGHATLIQKRITYLERLFEPEIINEIVNIFLFELQKIFEIKSFTQNKKINLSSINQKYKKFVPAGSSSLTIRQLVQNYLSSHLVNLAETDGYILTFYSIIEGLKNPHIIPTNKFAHFQSLEQLDQFLNKVKQVLNSITKATEDKIRSQFKQFLDKQENFENMNRKTRHSLIFALYHSARNYKPKANQQNKQNTFILDLKPFQNKITNIEVLRHINRQLFFSQENQGFFVLIRPKLLTKILQPLISETVIYLVQNQAEFFKKYYNTAGIGNYGQNVFARMVNQLKPQITLLLDQNNIQRFKIFNRQIPLFAPIPKNNSSNYKNWSFLSSIQQFVSKKLQQMKQERNKESFQYIERSYFMTTNENYISSDDKRFTELKTFKVISSNNNNSKSIDCAILKIQVMKTKTIPKVTITAFDVTLSRQQTTDKIKNFLHEFFNFKEKNSTSISLQGAPVDVSLDFFVICPDKCKENWIQLIQKDYGSEMIMKPMEDKTTIKVEGFKNGSPSFLKKFGYVTIGDRLLVQAEENEKQQNNPKSSLTEWRFIEKMVRCEV